MERENREKIADLVNYILENATKFSFIQVIRLLKIVVREGLLEEEVKELENKVRVRPKLSLDFPGTDIAEIEKIDDEHSKFLITATFLGIYGSSSPLPDFYTEDLLDEQREDKSIMRDFLDIINAPLYPILFQIWAKYQIPYKVVEEKDVETIQRLFALIGLKDENVRENLKHANLLLRYTSLITQFPRSAESLRLILKDALQLKSVDIIQCVEQTLTIDEEQRCYLGKLNNRLSENCVIGMNIRDKMGKFRIVIEVDEEAELFSLFPDGNRFLKMKELIKFFLTTHYQWDVKLLVNPKMLQTTRLGETNWNRLGWNTWLFSEKLQSKQYVLISC
ncbi:type VI secretion system baseplate subunit TssG [Deferribacter abyssi]|uniref:type VI secretion system baseplate subunit TssG n=1 Tax=Deferribacter abyssi TaxID=213806 RepID=UPI003C27529E